MRKTRKTSRVSCGGRLEEEQQEEKRRVPLVPLVPLEGGWMPRRDAILALRPRMEERGRRRRRRRNEVMKERGIEGSS